MTNLPNLIGLWGYPAIFLVVVLGNAGLPVPEETILGVAGYMVWKGHLSLWIVLVVGVVSAVVGDNIGYWVGRRWGKARMTRYAHWALGHPERLDSMRAFVARRGPLAVFLARFIPGVRFMAGPLAGSLGLHFGPFFVANVLGAMIYVPVAVGLGYAVGYGLGEYVERLRRLVGDVERALLVGVLLGAVVVLGWRTLRTLRDRKQA
ncbi:MAG TPA: DedA family protein [Methylomirabilota bacterium]|nr:DedA family protein [Methylomirabilota bacterium]